MTSAWNWCLVCTLAVAAVPAFATDLWEPDGDDTGWGGSNFLYPGAPPQVHDLEGNPDYDWFVVTLRPHRSYEARLTNVIAPSIVAEFARYAFSGPFTTPLQVGDSVKLPNLDVTGPAMLRWETADMSGFQFLNRLKVKGPTVGSASTQYTIAFRDTTLFCPRYNNTSSQTSVLLVQAAPEGANSCVFTARFINEAGSVIATQAGTLGESELRVIATSSVPGVANTKGSARVTHTCGLNRIKAKLVALEPATGFSFDTPCSGIE
jgi:hypothetical protein